MSACSANHVKQHVFLMNAFSFVCVSFLVCAFMSETYVNVFFRLTPLICPDDELHVSTVASVNDIEHAHSLHQINYSGKFYSSHEEFFRAHVAITVWWFEVWDGCIFADTEKVILIRFHTFYYSLNFKQKRIFRKKAVMLTPNGKKWIKTTKERKYSS